MNLQYANTGISTNSLGIVTTIDFEENFPNLLSLQTKKINADTPESPTKIFWNLKSSTGDIDNAESFQPKKRVHPLIKFLGAWEGDDIKDMLKLVYITRSRF